MHPLTRESMAAALAAFDRVPIARDGRRPAAVAITLVDDDEGTGVLLTRRAESLRAYPGQWSMPGGIVDEGESVVDGVLREMHEELGVVLSSSCQLGLLDDYATRSGYVITPIVLWAGLTGPLTLNPAEVSAVRVVPLAVLDIEPRLVPIDEAEWPVIQLNLFGTEVYAPTAALLYQFREVVFHGRATRVAHYEQPVFAWGSEGGARMVDSTD